jgi:hypothetical protein
MGEQWFLKHSWAKQELYGSAQQAELEVRRRRGHWGHHSACAVWTRVRCVVLTLRMLSCRPTWVLMLSVQGLMWKVTPWVICRKVGIQCCSSCLSCRNSKTILVLHSSSSSETHFILHAKSTFNLVIFTLCILHMISCLLVRSFETGFTLLPRLAWNSLYIPGWPRTHNPPASAFSTLMFIFKVPWNYFWKTVEVNLWNSYSVRCQKLWISCPHKMDSP